VKNDDIDVVGHFGTTFSYATVGSEVALALLRDRRLGHVTNLDPSWHPAHERLRLHAQRRLSQSPSPGSAVFIVAAPNEYLAAFCDMYGRERSIIFVSPNTNALALEHAQTCARFGAAIAPSEWCAAVVNAALLRLGADTHVSVLPLGADPVLMEEREVVIGRLYSRMTQGEHRPRVLHLSTDQSWPGRKGTEELLHAWALLFGGQGLDGGADLVVHVPPSLRAQALHMTRDLEIDESCTVVCGEMHGGVETLPQLFENADLVVTPSRCEGFGIMLLSTLVAGVPLLTTYETGQRDFLATLPGWMGIPCDPLQPLAGETGLAPVVNRSILADHLAIALQLDVRLRLLDALERSDTNWRSWTWRRASRKFSELLCELLDREDERT